MVLMQMQLVVTPDQVLEFLWEISGAVELPMVLVWIATALLL